MSIALVTITGLGAISETEDTAHRREAYINGMIEVKASALATIMLDPTKRETADVFAASVKSIDSYGQAALSIIKRPEVREDLKKILDKWAQYQRTSAENITLAASDLKAANDRLVPIYNGQFKPMQVALEKFIEARQHEAADGIAKAKAVSERVFWQVLAILGVVSVACTSLVIAITLSLRKALDGMQKPLALLKNGDLTQRLPSNGKDELSEIGAGVNAFVAELQDIVKQTRIRSRAVTESANRFADSAKEVMRSTAEQSDATSTVAASVEQFSVSIDQVSDNANQAEMKASRSGSLSQSGETEVREAISEICRIEQVVGEATRQIHSLGDQARAISSIVNVIKDVADQTNLLALNAAIEAARAGEQGRGFAVVADEVRKLAERTAASAQEITAMVESVQASTEVATGVMQKGNDMVVQSVAQIEKAGNLMLEVRDSSAGVVGAITDISSALSEQRLAGAEIAKNVEKIAQMTESGRASASEVTRASGELEQLAQELSREVEKFRV
jgi:methyl-accepting chemotaxis protein